MMSPTMQMPAPAVPYTPTSDAMDRHEYGITKNRKMASTGGGRAWSEDEVRDTQLAGSRIYNHFVRTPVALWEEFQS